MSRWLRERWCEIDCAFFGLGQQAAKVLIKRAQLRYFHDMLSDDEVLEHWMEGSI